MQAIRFPKRNKLNANFQTIFSINYYAIDSILKT